MSIEMNWNPNPLGEGEGPPPDSGSGDPPSPSPSSPPPPSPPPALPVSTSALKPDDWYKVLMNRQYNTQELPSLQQLCLHSGFPGKTHRLEAVVDRDWADQQELELMKQLLDSGADVNGRDEAGCTALHNALKETLLKREQWKHVVKLLLDRGADVNAAAPDGTTPLHLAVQDLCLPVVKALLAAGAQLEAKAQGQYTPFFYACIRGTEEIAMFLLDRGAEARVEDSQGGTPLHCACFHLWQNLIPRLLKAGLDVNATTTAEHHFPEGFLRLGNKMRKTPLGCAIQGRDLCKDSWSSFVPEKQRVHPWELLKLLLAEGADARSAWGCRDVLFITIHGGNYYSDQIRDLGARKEFIAALVERGADRVQALAGVAAWGLHPPPTESLRPHGVDERDASQDTAILIAARRQELRACQTLVELGADVSATDFKGNTVLHAAVDKLEQRYNDNNWDRSREEDLVAIAKLLIEKGAAVNARNNAGATPLLVLAQAAVRMFDPKPRRECGRVLLKAGADPSATDEQGNSAAEFMAMLEKPEEKGSDDGSCASCCAIS